MTADRFDVAKMAFDAVGEEDPFIADLAERHNPQISELSRLMAAYVTASVGWFRSDRGATRDKVDAALQALMDFAKPADAGEN